MTYMILKVIKIKRTRKTAELKQPQNSALLTQVSGGS